jgi:hypothetical protein
VASDGLAKDGNLYELRTIIAFMILDLATSLLIRRAEDRITSNRHEKFIVGAIPGEYESLALYIGRAIGPNVGGQ